MKHIYIYTTPSYKRNNWYKIGETVQDPIKRVQSQDNASNPEPLIFIAAWTVPDKLTDKKVHSALEKLGFDRVRKTREWFELSDTPEDDVASALATCTNNFVTYGIELMPIPLFNVPNYTEIWWYNGRLCPLLSGLS